MAGQSEMQTLKEEIEFMRRVHRDELKELQTTLEEEGQGFDRELWQNELSNAIRDIQERYDAQLDKIRRELEDMYNCRVSSLCGRSF